MSVVNQSKVFEVIRSIYTEITDRKIEGSEDEAFQRDLIRDEGLDSLDLINMLFRIEEEFGTKVPEPDIDNFDLTNIGNLVAYILERSRK